MRRLLMLFMLVSAGAHADGLIEINQACVAEGCFAGDGAGFPVAISEPGSYQLTSNINTGGEPFTAIRIDADRVTLDLNGFSVVGPQSCSYDEGTGDVTCGASPGVAHYLIAVEGVHNTIRNGTVQGAYSYGLDLRAPGPHRVKAMHFTQNGTSGLTARQGTAALVSDSVASVNENQGFQAYDGEVRFSNNLAYRNGAHGFIGGVCKDNTSANNGTDYQGCTDLGGNSP